MPALTVSGEVQVSDGAWNDPSLHFTTATNTGLFSPSASQLGVSIQGSEKLTITNSDIYVGDQPIRWSVGFGNGADTGLVRNAAGVLEINNGTAGTYRDLRVRAIVADSGSASTPGYGFADGTGMWDGADELLFSVNGQTKMRLNTGSAISLPSDGALVRFGGFDGDTDLRRQGAAILEVTDTSGGGGVLQFTERTAPSAPSTNKVVIFAQDNGSGKTQLMALFATGAAQQVAIEP